MSEPTYTETEKLLNLYERVKASETTRREIWDRCFNYVNARVDGKLGQWRGDDRKILEDEGRPIVTINLIKRFVNRICGSQRQTKLDEKCYPRDDEGDAIIAQIFTDLIKYVHDVNQTEWAIAKAFRDMVICGLGWMKVEWSDELEDTGEVTLKYVSPKRVYLLGDGFDIQIERDRKGVVEEILMDKDEIIARWPLKKDEIEGVAFDSALDTKSVPVAGDNYEPTGAVSKETYFDDETKKFKVLRFQLIKYRDLSFVENTQTGERTEAPDAETATAAADIATQGGVPHRVINKKKKYVHLVTLLGRVELENTPSPYTRHNGFDLVPCFGYTDDGEITGIVQDLLDPQDEKNKRRSQIIKILGTTAKNNHFVKAGALQSIDDAKKQMGGTGQLIVVNGNPRDVTSPIETNLTALPAIINMEMSANAEMKEISGISDAALGVVPEGVKSGRGIQELKQGVDEIIAEIFDNYLMFRKNIALKCVALMQQFYTTKKRVRILGDYTRAFIPPEIEGQVKAGLMDIQEGSKLVTINAMVGDQKLNDIGVGKYDIVIDSVSQNPTTRRALLFDLQNMRAVGIPIPNKTIIEYSDIKNKNKVIADMENEQMMLIQQAAQKMMSENMQGTATPSKPAEHDILGNVAGAQQR